MALQVAQHARRDGLQNLLHVQVRQHRQRSQRQLAIAVLRVRAVEKYAMEVRIESKVRARPLDRGHRTGAAVGVAEVRQATLVEALDAAVEDAVKPG